VSESKYQHLWFVYEIIHIQGGAEMKASKQNEYSKNYQQKNKDLGLCPCGRDRREGKVRCQKCADDRQTWYKDNRDVTLERAQESHMKLKQEVITAYGGSCVCCGEDWLPFLVLDHINGGGSKHRQQIETETGSRNLYAWVKRNKYPKGIQVLCANCNMAKGSKGHKCIHELQREYPSDPGFEKGVVAISVESLVLAS
jgi:hypothetical protein